MTLSTLLPVVAAALLLSACGSTPSVNSNTDFDPGFDFSGARKIAIQPVIRANLESVRISDMQVARISGALEDQLETQGFQIVDDNLKADLWMTWHLVTEERMDVRSFNSGSRYNCWRCGPSVSDVSVRHFTQGTLIVDMIDPNRNRSVWRSVVQSRLRQSDAEQAEALRRAAARAAFAEFPPN